jgi:hypothetical protein
MGRKAKRARVEARKARLAMKTVGLVDPVPVPVVVEPVVEEVAAPEPVVVEEPSTLAPQPEPETIEEEPVVEEAPKPKRRRRRTSKASE